MERNHRPDCLENQKRLFDWLEKWPNHCPGCFGSQQWNLWGKLVIPKQANQFNLPCVCVNENRCPRCRYQVVGRTWISSQPCIHCGWDWGRGPEDVVPYFICFCPDFVGTDFNFQAYHYGPGELIEVVPCSFCGTPLEPLSLACRAWGCGMVRVSVNPNANQTREKIAALKDNLASGKFELKGGYLIAKDTGAGTLQERPEPAPAKIPKAKKQQSIPVEELLP